MAESTAELLGRLEAATTLGFRERLLDKGLARGLIWQDGTLPPDSPQFPTSLTEDLLDYAHTVLAMALRLRSQTAEAPVLTRAFLVAGEALEAAVHRGDNNRSDRGFNRVSAAVAFHLARYAARAYSILRPRVAAENLAPTEVALVQLLRRALDEMHTQTGSWLLSEEHQDTRVAQRLRNDVDFDETDAVNVVLTNSFMRGLALFDHAITTGEAASADEAKQRLFATAEAARGFQAVSHWWTATLAAHLIDELWNLSLYHQIPVLSPNQAAAIEWNSVRCSYIQRLRAGKRAAIELWPSQLEAAQRAADHTDNLVVALPTSAGKTRIAELCILRALALNHRVIYVTPLRALSAQVEHDLAETFIPLGFSVSSLYGSAGIESGDAETLREGKIVVSTPEKLDFALRNDPSIIDDVKLVVLDEGHMLGPNEREVRYEALVQRLLRRSDAEHRRIVCLSALFPTPEKMDDIVAWIRRDEPGGPVYSTWRPTRQRFGVLRWISDAARLDVKVEEESPFVPRFIESRKAPEGSSRRKNFPADKNELTLATAWRFIEQEKNVLVYCSLRKSVETLGKHLLKCIEQGVLKPLREPNQGIRDAMTTGAEWLGAHHPSVQCLQYGVALHHAGLPRAFLNEVEGLLRSGDCRLTIASPTLAQGLNLSASVLLVPSIWRNRNIIPVTEFANVAGRAGRAFSELEGLILHIVWEKEIRRRNWAIQQWEELVAKAKAPKIASGLLQLVVIIFKRISTVAGVPIAEVVEYVTGHDEAWDTPDSAMTTIDVSAADWERDVASLDAAILALLDSETDETKLDIELDSVLEGSLFSRQLEQQQEKIQELLRGFLRARAHRIWSQTTGPQRKAYHVAGVGFHAGKFLDANIENLFPLLLGAEAAVLNSDPNDLADATVEFAALIFHTAPFRAPGEMPDSWKEALRAWIMGRPASEVISIGGDEGVELLQDALTYRLPWAMEAVRVHAVALEHDLADLLQGIAALAVEVGTANRTAITLLRSGLSSRDAAFAAVASTQASFTDRSGMIVWLRSDKLEKLSSQKDWPTAETRHAWLEFYKGEMARDRRKWTRETQSVRVHWYNDAPVQGTHVVLEPSARLVLTPDFVKLGVLESAVRRSRQDIVGARVGNSRGVVVVEFFGPPENSQRSK